MTVSTRLILVVLSLGIAFTSEAAYAENAQIVFSGTIASPTCPPPPLARVSAAPPAPQRLSCPLPGKASGNPTSYVLTTERLNGEQPDKVLAYFADYVEASRPGTDAPILQIQTYN